ncbi:MAG TPA: DUF2237 domain-containing protein [Devosia sp.]|jgi:uncharacterized protein (DUF2237 family)|nr:DUF2237 domain-containing protein [Devosia sp.]
MSLAERNVFGEPLVPCSTDPMTGFFRTGACAAGPDDIGRHLICCEMTAEFLAFSKSVGNDLSTPHPEWGFPGLEPGDRWCLVAARWVEAHKAGAAPRVALLSTHEAALRYTDLATLKAYALDLA